MQHTGRVRSGDMVLLAIRTRCHSPSLQRRATAPDVMRARSTLDLRAIDGERALVLGVDAQHLAATPHRQQVPTLKFRSEVYGP